MCVVQVSFNWFHPENQLVPARPVRRQSSAGRMTRVRDFVADLSRAGKSFSEIKKPWKLPTGTRA